MPLRISNGIGDPFKGTLELALGLHPGTKRVVVVSGTSTSAHDYKSLASSKFRDYAHTVDFIELDALLMPERLEPIAQPAQGTIILHVIFSQDGASKSFIEQEALSRVAQPANVPRFTVDTLATASEFLYAGRQPQMACLVLDIHLPGMAGFQFQEHLAISGLRIPVVLITAHDDAPTRERASKAGSIGYLRKPFD